VLRKKSVLFVLVAVGAAALFASDAWATPAPVADYAAVARDIVPAGEYNAIPTPSTLPAIEQQAQMYNALTPLFNNVTDTDLTNDFKAEPLNVADAPGPTTQESVPHAGVTVYRDAYNVPYIYGTTYDDLTWAAGWIEAEDQGLLLQQARYVGRLAAIDAPGYNTVNLIASLASFKPSAQTEHAVGEQTNALLAQGAKGRAVLHDLRLYIQGINAYIAAHNDTLGIFGNVAPFTLTDIYAFNAIKDQFVGEGGGNQAANSEFLAAVEQRLGKERGFAVWNDLREAYDPAAPASVPGHVELQPRPKSMAGNVLLDPGSLSASVRTALASTSRYSPHASNELIVSGARSATHHPIMVAGPQIGYFYPGFTTEVVLNAPGVHQRGVTSVPFPGYIFIGRSQDQAWTLTSAGLDQIDTYAETLCGHSIHRYMFDGKCRAMQFFDAGRLTAGVKTSEVTFWRTVHGPVLGYARVHGRLVALTHKRASYGKDVLDLLFYHDLAHGQVHNIHQFFRAADQTPQTFNSFYIDDKDIGVFTSGLVPIRPSNVDPDLPINGTGHEEWRGFVSFKNHPQGINPPSGEIINWNNRPEAGYEAPDNNWSLGAIHRVDLLIDDLGHGSNLTPARVVSGMNEAATQDVREVLFEPVLSKLLHGGAAPNARDGEMLALLDAWHQHGSSRLDRTSADGLGQITDPGAAIMDAAFPLLAEAWGSVVLGPQLEKQLASFVSVFEKPSNGAEHGGQEHGWFDWMYKDLRAILGEKVAGKFAVRYCGAGSLRRCRALMWAAMTKAGNELAAAQGPNPAGWRSSAAAEAIVFLPGILPYKMRYTNRPTGIQQVLSFDGHAPGDG
jgi:acyl-homoserine lactone acylase PvdQ